MIQRILLFAISWWMPLAAAGAIAWIIFYRWTNIWCALVFITGIIADIACQLWLDLEDGAKWIAGRFKKRVKLDETEKWVHNDISFDFRRRGGGIADHADVRSDAGMQEA